MEQQYTINETTLNDSSYDLENIIKLKFLLKEASKNLSELQKINISPNNLELQKLKENLKISMNIEKPSTFSLTCNYLLLEVEKYLKKNCKHNYIEDTYDIGEDGFKKLCYCNKCFHGY